MNGFSMILLDEIEKAYHSFREKEPMGGKYAFIGAVSKMLNVVSNAESVDVRSVKRLDDNRFSIIIEAKRLPTHLYTGFFSSNGLECEAKPVLADAPALYYEELTPLIIQFLNVRAANQVVQADVIWNGNSRVVGTWNKQIDGNHHRFLFMEKEAGRYVQHEINENGKVLTTYWKAE